MNGLIGRRKRFFVVVFIVRVNFEKVIWFARSCFVVVCPDVPARRDYSGRGFRPRDKRLYVYVEV
jgi:hypothetical protein